MKNNKIILIINILFSFILIPVTIMALVYPPVIISQGQAHRIFYIHVPIAWVSMYSPIIGCIAGILFILTKKSIYDRINVTSMKVAFTFAIGVVISGPLWASTEWGTFWNWKDPRLMSFFVLLLTISSFFIVRNFTEDPQKKGTYSAIMTILATFASIFTWFSIRILTPDTHPGPVLNTMSPKIKTTFWISVLGYHFFFLVIFYLTYQYEKIYELYQKIKLYQK
jgi:heme exporter protein C